MNKSNIVLVLVGFTVSLFGFANSSAHAYWGDCLSNATYKLLNSKRVVRRLTISQSIATFTPNQGTGLLKFPLRACALHESCSCVGNTRDGQFQIMIIKRLSFIPNSETGTIDGVYDFSPLDVMIRGPKYQEKFSIDVLRESSPGAPPMGPWIGI